MLTLEGGRGEENRQPPLQKKKNPCSVISVKPERLQILRRTFTDLDDLGKGIVLLVFNLSIKEKILSGPACLFGGILRGGVCSGRFTDCCSSGLRSWTGVRAWGIQITY